ALAIAMSALPAQAALSQPAGYPIAGVDTSEYQHPNNAAIDWSKLHTGGVQFAIVKATRGLNVTDPYLTTDLEAARAAGVAVPPSHFYTAPTANTGAAQADRFIAAVKQTGYTGHNSGDLPPVFDLEYIDDGSNHCPANASVDDAKAWLDTVEAAFGRKP